MWKLSGQAGLLGGRPHAVPGRIAGIDVEHVDDRAPVPLRRDPLELGDGRPGELPGSFRPSAGSG